MQQGEARVAACERELKEAARAAWAELALGPAEAEGGAMTSPWPRISFATSTEAYRVGGSSIPWSRYGPSRRSRAPWTAIGPGGSFSAASKRCDFPRA